MDLEKKQYVTEVGGKTLTLEISRLAEQANAAVLAKYGETIVLATTVMGKKDREIGFFPLVVDYEERFYAAGKIIGSRFVRREGRPSEEAILSGRLVDRTIRPLFDKRMRRDVQVVLTILSYDEENDPDFVGLVAASTALSISDIPWNGPVAGMRIAKIGGEIILNPTNSKLKEDGVEFEAFISGTESRINMIELGGNDAEEENILNGFSKAHEEIKKIISLQKTIVSEIGKAKAVVPLIEPKPELKSEAENFLSGKLEEATYAKDKVERVQKIDSLKHDLKAHLLEKSFTEKEISQVEEVIDEETDKLLHKKILLNNERPDGRKLDELRKLQSSVAIFERTHGSALFVRGNTQALAITTLAAPGAEQIVETMTVTGKKRFLLHYNFPAYSVGEIGPFRGPGRREIGHGALALKAIMPVIPSEDEFPYTVRVVSEVLSSNGSSSMATVCASILSLMDAGVPIKKMVAGIAMGMITGEDGTYKVLTDIQGPEDHHGDMDFKVAGTTEGVNAIQMDVKIEGATVEMLRSVLNQAKAARYQILDVMKTALTEPRPEISNYAPSIIVLDIDPSRIGEVIGPGGKMINSIIRETGALSIDIEQTGKVFVAGASKKSAEDAANRVRSIVKEFEIGEIIEGKVVRLLEFGAIVDLGGGRDGMIHVSELKNGFVKKVEDVVKMGDTVKAKIIKIEDGKIGLSIKQLEQK